MDVLETERLILRRPVAEDFPAYAHMWADPDVNRFLGGVPLSEEEAWLKFMRAFGHWALMGYGFWAVCERNSGARIGATGLLNVKRAIAPSLEGTPEIGWSFAKPAQGKGYATEAVRAALAWGDRRFGKPRICCIIAPDNAASLNVAAKTGFREAARTTYKAEPTILLYRDPPHPSG